MYEYSSTFFDRITKESVIDIRKRKDEQKEKMKIKKISIRIHINPLFNKIKKIQSISSKKKFLLKKKGSF